MDDTTRIAENLVALLRRTANTEAYRTLYAPDAQCVEADPARSRSGLARLTADMRAFEEQHEFNYERIEGPIVVGDSFALALEFRARNRGSGAEFTVKELAVYTVRDGLIAREQFFYQV